MSWGRINEQVPGALGVKWYQRYHWLKLYLQVEVLRGFHFGRRLILSPNTLDPKHTLYGRDLSFHFASWYEILFNSGSRVNGFKSEVLRQVWNWWHWLGWVFLILRKLFSENDYCAVQRVVSCLTKDLLALGLNKRLLNSLLLYPYLLSLRVSICPECHDCFQGRISIIPFYLPRYQCGWEMVQSLTQHWISSHLTSFWIQRQGRRSHSGGFIPWKFG